MSRGMSAFVTLGVIAALSMSAIALWNTLRPQPIVKAKQIYAQVYWLTDYGGNTRGALAGGPPDGWASLDFRDTNEVVRVQVQLQGDLGPTIALYNEDRSVVWRAP